MSNGAIELNEAFFKPLVDKACELINPKKIILFGSFARQDNHSKSDIDLAFDFDSNNWARFTFWVEDEFATLRELDLVDMRSAGKDILESINREGVVLYER